MHMLSNPNKCCNFKASTNYENSVFFQTLVEQDENVSSQVRWFRKQILTQIGILEIYQIVNGLVTNTSVLREGKRKGKEAGLCRWIRLVVIQFSRCLTNPVQSSQARIAFIFVLRYGGMTGPTYHHNFQSRLLPVYVWSLTNIFQ